MSEALWWFGSLAVIKLEAADTEGRVSVVEVTEPPGAEAPLHVHHREDETFCVLDGSVTFEVGGATVEAGPGGVAFGPRDVPHRYTVGSDGCRMLFILTPGGFEGAIRELSTPARGLELPPESAGPPDMEGIEERIAPYGCEMVDEMPDSPWEAGARDWAEAMEGWNGWGVPVYRHVLGHVEVGPGTDLLDVGCGAGRFCRIAADRGASVAGLDATQTFVEIAQERVMGGDFRVGDMANLPWPDDSFDVVTGFNSFFIAADMVGALAEAGRVARPGGRIAMTVFGRPEHCQSTALFASLRQFAPAGGGEANGGPGLHEEGVLEERVAEAGLTTIDAGYLPFAEVYPDRETMLRGYLAAPPFRRAAGMAGEAEVRDALAEAIEALRTESGVFRLEDEVRFVIASA